MERTVSATEARVHFGEMIRRVTEGQETIIVQRSGEAQLVLLSLRQYEQYMPRQGQGDWLKELEAVHEMDRQELGGRTLPASDDLIYEMRAERSAHLSALVDSAAAVEPSQEEMSRVNWQERVSLEPDMLIGKPVVKGTRLAVEFIVGLLAQGWSEDEILGGYPELTSADVRACLAYAVEALQHTRALGVAGSRRVRMIRISRAAPQS